MNEILNNEEIIVDVIEETAGNGKVGKYVAVGLAIGVGAVALYKGGKLVVNKVKTKLEQRKSKDVDEIVVDEADIIVTDYEEE